MRGLSDSRHAPGRQTAARQQQWFKPRDTALAPATLTVTPAPTGNGTIDGSGSNSASAAHDLGRYTKIVRRLKWKLPFLSSAYGLAVSRSDARDPAEITEAELMFKLDFFEYYMLLERALVHLLGVFSVVISCGSAAAPPFRPSQHASSNHRYHANVLEALDNPDNPLHQVLGTGEVRLQLGRAKYLRNKWKTAADDIVVGDGNGNHGSGGPAVKPSAPVESFDMERMLTAIFDGFDAAFLIAERFVLSGRGDALNQDQVAMEEERWDYEFMVDAMDWEAV